MSIDWGLALASASMGALNGIDRHRELERQKESDRQAKQLHDQKVQLNQNTLDTQAFEVAKAKRADDLNKKIGMYQQYSANGDIGSAAQLYVDNANLENSTNPNFNPDHILKYDIDPDNNTVSLNLVDKNTGNLVRQLGNGLTTNDFISHTYDQIDPTKSYENRMATNAEIAKESRKNKFELDKEDRKNKFELDKMDRQSRYDVSRDNNKFRNDARMKSIEYDYDIKRDNHKAYNNLYLENIKQQGANFREQFKSGNKQQQTAASNLDGAIGYAKSNQPIMQIINQNQDVGGKALAMMAIESGGNPNAFSGSSYGSMQINGKYAQGFAKQFNINGDPVKDELANFQTGHAIINHLNTKYGGDTSLIAAAYNAGEPAIDSALKAWSKNGRQGSWFDYISDRYDKNQIYNHIVKYNTTLSMMNGESFNAQGQLTNKPNAVQTANANYQAGLSQRSNASIIAQAGQVAKDLGKPALTAQLQGGFSQAEPYIQAFVNGKNKNAKVNAYKDIYNSVKSTIQSTPEGSAMPTTSLHGYTMQVVNRMLGANSTAEVGFLFNENERRAKENMPRATMSGNEIDNVFDGPVAAKSTSKNNNQSNKYSTDYRKSDLWKSVVKPTTPLIYRRN